MRASRLSHPELVGIVVAGMTSTKMRIAYEVNTCYSQRRQQVIAESRRLAEIERAAHEAEAREAHTRQWATSVTRANRIALGEV